ncbi:MAG: Na/Pi symporter [Bacteroidota bacterium]
MTTNDIEESKKEKKYPGYISVFAVLGAVLLFLFSIMLMISSINSFGFSFSQYVVSATSNPFIGLFIGLLATALLQSSSTTTTIIVAAVASETVTLEGAIPIVLGANIGTTLTSTIVSMGYITKTNEFRKAVAAGTIHDLFNIIMVVIFFPIEIRYRVLENCSQIIANQFSIKSTSFLGDGYGFSAFFNTINNWLISHINHIFTLGFAIILLFICIKFISKLLYNILIGRAKKQFETTIFSNTLKSFSWGLFITSAAQSSSLTTSLIVPLVATGKVKLIRAFQFILGANIGTTLTALLAAIFQSQAAVEIALVHLLFNTAGVLIVILIPYLSTVMVFLAEKLGEYTLKLRIVGFIYILFTFFLLPFTLIYVSRGFEKKPDTWGIISED